MKRIVTTLILMLVAANSPAATAQPSPRPPPSLEEIRSDVAAADYNGALRKIETLLFPTSSDRASRDRYELLMLKGECRLQLKDGVGARGAFESAAKVAGDAAELAAARANALIIAKSFSGRYAPPGSVASDAIDILPLESRKRAMDALRADLWAQQKAPVEAALRGTKLAPIEKVFDRVADVFALETFATGQATETGPIMRQLGGHAYGLMQTEVSRCGGRADELFQMANSIVDTGGSRDWSADRRGLASRERDEIRAMLPELTRIRDRAGEYRRTAARFGGDEAKWDALVADATETIAEVDSLSRDR